MRLSRLYALTLAVAGLALVAGCSNPATPQPATPQALPPATTTGPQGKVAVKDEEHGHKAGSHGGIMVAIGRDSYHAEAVFEKGGTLRLYMLGQDESKVLEVESQKLEAFARAEGADESTRFTLGPTPAEGDSKDKTSQFAGKLPKELVGKRVEVTIPNVRIAGERFRLGFKSGSEVAHGGGQQMPAAVVGEDERELYLTAGGLYTEADIKANGNVVASQKFKGVTASHDAHPKPGDKVCPVTDTVANPKFSWVIGGKTYEFCCPPCVDEFLTRARERPSEILPPEAYRKR